MGHPEESSQDSSTVGESFHFSTVSAGRIFDYLTQAFDRDYMTKRFARDDSGWRTLGDIAKDSRISRSMVYPKGKNELSPPIQELLRRGLVERRFYQNERGRGGEVTRFRIAYDNELIRRYVDQKIRQGESATSKMTVATTTASAESTKLVGYQAERYKRIAVLPFANYSPDPSDEYFADGLTEELISTLSKISQLRVSSRTSIMTYKQLGKRLTQMAAELQVEYVLEGSVRKAKDELRISVQLIDIQKGEHLWSQDYDRKFENVFSLQKEIALNITDNLKISILPKERSEIGKKITQNMDAYALYLKARSHKVRSTLDSFNHFVDYCKQAIEKDPNFVQAHAEVAIAYVDAGDQELLPAEETFPLAESFAEKAVKLDSSNAVTHLALGLVKWVYRWDFHSAETELRRAIELDPGLVEAHLELSLLLASLRKFDEALDESKRALELDPFSSLACFNVGTALYVCHQYDQAVEMLKNAIQLDPTGAIIHDNLGNVYIKKEMHEDAILEIRKAIEFGAGKLQKGTLGYANARAGKESEARKIIDELLMLRQRGERTETVLALVCIGLRDYDEAISWLEAAYEYRLGYLATINCDPLFDDLRPYPRYQALLKKIGFPDAGD